MKQEKKTYTLDIIKKEIEESQILSAELEKENYDKMQYSNPHDRYIQRLRVLESFLHDFEVDSVLYDYSFIYYRNIIISPKTFKWRVSGKSKWYENAFKHKDKIINSDGYDE